MPTDFNKRLCATCPTAVVVVYLKPREPTFTTSVACSEPMCLLSAPRTTSKPWTKIVSLGLATELAQESVAVLGAAKGFQWNSAAWRTAEPTHCSTAATTWPCRGHHGLPGELTHQGEAVWLRASMAVCTFSIAFTWQL